MKIPSIPLVLAALAPQVIADSGTLRVHPDNPRYLEWRGRPTVLVASGEHYGAVLNPDFDYALYLRTIAAAGLNHTRTFLGSYVEWPQAFAIADNTLAPAPGRFLAPWARSSTPGFSLGGNKFDLDRWDEAFFTRLHAFLDDADRLGIVVETVLFFSGPGWDHMPLNPRNNVNGTDDVGAIRYLTLDCGNILARQEAFARKLTRELNRHGNVIINLCNEPWFNNQERPGFVSQPPVATKAWIQRVAAWVRDEESRLPNKHVVCTDISNQGTVITAEDLARYFGQIDGFNVHYDGNGDSLALNPWLPRYLAFNETGFNGTGDAPYRTQGWNYLLGGGAVYSHLDFSFTVGHEDGTAKPMFTDTYYNGGGGVALRGQLAVLLDFMRSIPFASMHRDDSAVVGGADSWRALVQPGVAWAYWFPGDGPVAPVLALPPGRYRAEWVDILTGDVTAQHAESKHWITTFTGVRRGGGAALRVFPERMDQSPQKQESPLRP